MTAGVEELRLAELLPWLESRLPQILAEIIELLESDFPDYAAHLALDSADSLEMATVALRHLVTLAAAVPNQRTSPVRSTTASPGIFEEVGRIEWREGRDLGPLLSAYRAGGRVAWRHVSEVAVQRHLPASAVATLAEAVFLFIEQLSSASAHGYVEEQRATAAERERLRSRLAELLIAGSADTSVVQAIALRAGWTLPTTAAIVLVDATREGSTSGLDRLDPTSLPLRTSTLTGAIVADPEAPARRSVLERALAGCGAVVGSAVKLADLPNSRAVVEAALRLRTAGVLAGDPLFVSDHFDTVVVRRDPWVLDRLRAQVLAPLDDLPPATRERLEETLAAWLAAAGDRRVAAGLLRVHPQTVRYRLRQITDRFGAALTDPQTRLRLTLALCWSTRLPGADLSD